MRSGGKPSARAEVQLILTQIQPSSHWLLWQLADSAFPTGGFAHSGGLEAAVQRGEIKNEREFECFLNEALWASGFGALPLATTTHRAPERLEECDSICDAFLSNPVANRASRVQGRAFLSTCERSFATDEIRQLAALVRRQSLCQHQAPVFGAVLAALKVDLASMQGLSLQIALRGILSAAVRLGLFGPYQAQRVQLASSSTLDRILERCGEFQVEDIAQTAPLLDLFQSTHDQLYSRLFQS